MLINFLAEHKTISVNGCIAQMFFIILSGSEKLFILSAITYDHYVAICDPLNYMEKMRKEICVQLASGTWAMGLFHALLTTVLTLKLHFCGPNQISHFSCEFPHLLQLSCTETLTNQVVLLTSTMIFGSSFLFTLISYIHVITTILKVRSAEGRHKTFSTCSSHLIVVGLLYMTVFFQYTKPRSVSSVLLDEMLSLQYSILTPMLNPITHSLKNREV
ncbi:olfactory receptor 5V1-like [Trachemys scripta elegans]|uniref:olfactory receptor 5V1-like n=1 Tax=Trachemys scripta elegans TaxID=31138 RepID=UPI0015540CF2|nr:olfactory receptor 5V1-like [Trachemys scripta elegans]